MNNVALEVARLRDPWARDALQGPDASGAVGSMRRDRKSATGREKEAVLRPLWRRRRSY